jgi:demethylmenaquinone methyltransferase/2-methoxy-6-polyprenyl-1,4-benzoquinol methylase/ArsR family transcriptional regulator
LIVVDFAPHTQEVLREKHAHRRLGFPAEEIGDYLEQAGLELLSHRDLAPLDEGGKENLDQKLTVSLWLARDPREAALQESKI